MGYQTTMSRGLRFRKPEGILGNLTGLTGDIASLAELQAELVAVDLKDTVGRATWPGVVLVVSAVLLVATLPVLLIGLAFALASALAISQAAALLLTGGIFALVAAVVGTVAALRFLRSFESFRRSREELVRNVSWIRTVITQSGKTVHRPQA